MIWSMADGQAKLLSLALEKAESELREQKNREKTSELHVKYAEVQLEIAQLQLKASHDHLETFKLKGALS